MFRKICVTRAFEFELARVYNTGAIKMPVYLSVGEENAAAAISTVTNDFQIFAQHRCHAYYLAFGGDMRKLIDELLHRPSGCAKGMGGSASIHSPEIRMYGHSGLMGDQVPIAVGAAFASRKPTITVVGDASAEEDYIWSAMGYASTKRVPLLMVCEDNDLSILTHVSSRRNWSVVDLARSLGIPAVDIADDPWLIAHHARNFKDRLPALINVRTCRNFWHAGTGNDGPPEWDRFALTKAEFKKLGLEEKAGAIEAEAKSLAEKTWQEQLRIP